MSDRGPDDRFDQEWPHALDRELSRIPLPPLVEQRRIVEHVQSGVSRLVEVRRNIETQLGRIREDRQTLVTAAVTGKIDVSKVAA